MNRASGYGEHVVDAMSRVVSEEDLQRLRTPTLDLALVDVRMVMHRPAIVDVRTDEPLQWITVPSPDHVKSLARERQEELARQKRKAAGQ